MDSKPKITVEDKSAQGPTTTSTQKQCSASSGSALLAPSLSTSSSTASLQHQFPPSPASSEHSDDEQSDTDNAQHMLLDASAESSTNHSLPSPQHVPSKPPAVPILFQNVTESTLGSAISTTTSTSPLRGDALSMSHGQRLRKLHPPVRSIKQGGGIEQGVVRLDVYSMYMRDPMQLLRSVRSEWSTRKGTAQSPGYARRRVASQPVLAAGLAGDFDFDDGQRFLRVRSEKKKEDLRTGLHGPPSLVGRAPPMHVQLEASRATSANAATTAAKGYVYATDEKFRNTVGAPTLKWEGVPLEIAHTEHYNLLTSEEIQLCRTLRVLPNVYLYVKESLLATAATKGFFKKRDAQRMFRMNVNKIARIYDWFRGFGWIPDQSTE